MFFREVCIFMLTEDVRMDGKGYQKKKRVEMWIVSGTDTRHSVPEQLAYSDINVLIYVTFAKSCAILLYYYIVSELMLWTL